MKIILSAFNPIKWLLLISCILGIIAGLGNTGILALINKVITNPLAQIHLIVIGYPLLLLVIFITESLSQSLFSYLSQTVILNLQTTLCKRVLSTPLRQLEQIGSTQIFAALSQDINTLGMAALTLPLFLINLIIVSACFIYLYILSAKIFLVSVSFLTLSIFIFFWVDSQVVKKRFEQARNLTDALFKGFQSVLSGIKELKLNAIKRNSFFEENIFQPAVGYRNEITKAMRIYAISQSAWKINFFIIIGIILLVFSSSDSTSPRILSNVIILIIFMIAPLSSIISLFPNIRRALVSVKKIESLDLSLSKPIDKEIKERLNDQVLWHEISLNNVEHTYYHEYEEKNFKLGPVSLSLHPGEIIFITGKNGCGKTTLIKLITSLYYPEKGEITIDKQNIDINNRDKYRQHFAAIFSDYHLFDGLYGIDLDVHKQSSANAYLKKLELDKKINLQYNKFSSLALSDGQRKRVALLAAYLEDKDIYVFDEWTANQDPSFKDFFYNELLLDFKNRNKCVIVVSHDKDYFTLGDKLIRMDNGRIDCVD